MEENKLQAAQPVIQATIQIKRAATGKVEEYKITGTPIPAPKPEGEKK